MNNPVSQLQACLDDETRLVREFIELLEAEAQVLAEGGQEDALAASTAQKEIYAAQLSQASQVRQALLAGLGHGTGRDGLDAAAGAHPALRGACDQLLEQTRKASELNAANGTIIETFLEHNQRALDTLRSLVGAESLYDAKGRTHPGAKGQSKAIKAG